MNKTKKILYGISVGIGTMAIFGMVVWISNHAYMGLWQYHFLQRVAEYKQIFPMTI